MRRGGDSEPVHVRGNKVTRPIAYYDREHALADLGLAADGDATGRRAEPLSRAMASECDATTDEQDSMLADEIPLVDYAHATVREKMVSQIDATCGTVSAQ